MKNLLVPLFFVALYNSIIFYTHMEGYQLNNTYKYMEIWENSDLPV